MRSQAISTNDTAISARETEQSVLLVHNHYVRPGGEEQAFFSEAQLLTQRGHEVIRFEEHNARASDLNTAVLALQTIWNRQSQRSLSEMIERHRPGVVHFHNTFPLISPSAYYAAKKSRAPVVQTLHNFRLFCLNGLLFREGHPCEQCLGGGIFPGVYNRCYRDSLLASSTVAAMIGAHRGLRTWTRAVDLYIAPSQFTRRKAIQGGLPPERVVVKPNFLAEDPGWGKGDEDYVLFAGRLSEEKGVLRLLEAWKRPAMRLPLRICGDGPLADLVARSAKENPRIHFLGKLERDAVIRQMKGARALILPSECYENSPLVLIEAFAVGLPVIASSHGAMADSVSNGSNGFHFRVTDPEDLVRIVNHLAVSEDHRQRMRIAARREYETHYTASANYSRLMEIYEAARLHTWHIASRS
jgi:glycosyltransferase involved in cell wall biosynthesis